MHGDARRCHRVHYCQHTLTSTPSLHSLAATMSEAQKEAPAEPVAMDTTPEETKPVEETWDDIPPEIMALSTDEINSRIRLIENDIKVRCLLYPDHKGNA